MFSMSCQQKRHKKENTNIITIIVIVIMIYIYIIKQEMKPDACGAKAHRRAACGTNNSSCLSMRIRM